LLFYAFMGFETPLSNGGEIKNVKRTVPLGISFGITGVLIIYLAIQLVTQGVLGETIAAHKDAPLAAVAGVVFGKVGITLITITIAISMLGALSGEILCLPRILFAGARDGLMPKVLSRVHPKFFTPYVAVMVYASLGLLFAIFGGFKQLAIIASASSLIIYLAAVLATLKLRRSSVQNMEKTFRVPGGVVIPMLAAGVIIWLLSNLTKQEVVGIAVFIAVFSSIYFGITIVKKKALKQAATQS
jgi:basic amino acid/polyamine antiporter, APA family